MKMMCILLGNRNYLRVFDREDLETFVDEGMPVALFETEEQAEEWLKGNGLEYEFVEIQEEDDA